MKDVLIAGSGIAGLSAGIHLLEAGQGRFRVRLVERGHVVGGKASSMPHRDRTSGRTFTVDHGFHVFFDYPNLGERLRSLGAFDGFSPPHHEVLIWSEGKVRPFRALPLPSPLHLFAGGWEAGLYSPLDGMRVFRFMVDIFLIEIDRLSAARLRELDAVSFTDYSRQQGLSDEIIQSSFFRFVTQSAFIYPKAMSALSAIAAIQLVAQNHDAVACRYIDGGCSEVIIDPLLKHFLRLGGVLDKFKAVERIHIDQGRVSSLSLAKNRRYIHGPEAADDWHSNYHSVEGPPPAPPEIEPARADWYVAALPPRDLQRVLAPESASLPYFQNLQNLETQRTIALTLWYDRVVSPSDADGAIIGLPGPFSTVADLRRLQRQAEGFGSVVQFVGEDGAYSQRTDDEIVRDALDVLHQLWPASRSAVLEKKLFHRGGHDAFFLTTPGSDQYRPAAASPHANLMLAGDFTQTGFRVICMEGAFISGMQAANEILAREGLRPVPVRPMKEPGGAISVMRRARRLLGAA